MKWPRGKYNGKRIGGFRIDFELNLVWWSWDFKWKPWGRWIHFGPIHIWIEMAYEK